MTIGGPTDGPTLYVFLAHWCPHCNDEIPELIELRNRAAPRGHERDRHQHRRRQHGAELSAVGVARRPGVAVGVARDGRQRRVDGFVVNGGGGFPYLMIVDADGNVLVRASGTKSAEELAVWISDALATAA
jgi:cytochrome c biogenesis protein CcmG, thiol:disulfide interchange protein DsbE